MPNVETRGRHQSGKELKPSSSPPVQGSVHECHCSVLNLQQLSQHQTTGQRLSQMTGLPPELRPRTTTFRPGDLRASFCMMFAKRVRTAEPLGLNLDDRSMQDAGGNMQAPQALQMCSAVQVSVANNTSEPTNISCNVQVDTGMPILSSSRGPRARGATEVLSRASDAK
ncbi:hypothetical protein BDP81DRAFT_454174 [Colletotrichum phormii]|uniref:Uncharacterized protein n=1 Tax=Colletotrichum phormii TaxID=359342 RepID=A0AAI9ZGB1_9PEZI|nr:uncharacterized protein BDP81DRAFT_454174 [Colletotrichum phormii]KAK1623722.1 hypothetical protein BDP81DRAFT_454174 [Colletotrichum phormii]